MTDFINFIYELWDCDKTGKAIVIMLALNVAIIVAVIVVGLLGVV